MHSTESEITKSRGKHISTSDLITLTVGCITILITILAVTVQISECLRKRKKEHRNLRDGELRIITRPQSSLSTSSKAAVHVHPAATTPQSSQRASRAVVYAHSRPSSSHSSQRSSGVAGRVHSRPVSSHSFQRASAAEHQTEPASP
ncbi:hypothetical protein DFP73DRAFT_595608 [Morchella snyderi]|nr:hypothetical protein DFP73DRAFT_595608 [Morchella snyderi]